MVAGQTAKSKELTESICCIARQQDLFVHCLVIAVSFIRDDLSPHSTPRTAPYTRSKIYL